jgi:signal transduction histidine kinase
MMGILIVTSLLAVIILRLRVFFSYLIYVVITLLFLMHSDGVTFKYFWPNHPVFNSYFSIIIGLAMAMAPYDFARVFLRTKTFHPKIDRFMIYMLVLTPIIVVPLAFIDAQKAKQLLMVLVFIGITAGIFAGLVASIKRFREVRFYVLAWVFAALSAGIMNLRHFTSVDISQNVELDSIRVLIIVDAIMMGLGVADRYLQNLRASRALDKMNLQQAQQNLKLNERLFDLEEQYKLATELVETRDIQLKNTVHDLRQPLHALRLNVKKLQNNMQSNTSNQADLDETFTYLETLIANHLQSSVRGGLTIETTPAKQENALNLPQILKSIHEMFSSDAENKGLDFRLVETTQQSDVPPLVIMRIITNIVSNAIKYTIAGKIILGVRRTHNAIRIEVHDTGPGLTEAQFSTAIMRGTRLSKNRNNSELDNSGSGLGLNIARSLAQEYGLELLRLSGRQKGTSLALVIPKSYALKSQILEAK